MPLIDMLIWTVLGVCLLATTLGIMVFWTIRRRNLQRWLPSYLHPGELSGSRHISIPEAETVHVFIAVCDHFEPKFGNPSARVSRERVERWVTEYPRLFGGFEDVDGRPPVWTFFYPQEEYAPEYVEPLAELRDVGLADVEIHLHHDNDTPEGLRDKLLEFRDTLYEQHGLLRKDPATGELVYGFIHGNWALCNSRQDGRWCGVNDELTVLQETGCYADFTMPSAPCETQTSVINSIYYARDLGGRPRSHETGIRSRVGQSAPADHLLLIQGPLLLDWSCRKYGVIPRIENADLHGGRPASWRRMQLWMRAGVHVAGRPNWKFVKLHTHGCNELNTATLLSPAMQRFHADLARESEMNPSFRYHYVSAWEMARLVHQAESGTSEPVFGERIPAGV